MTQLFNTILNRLARVTSSGSFIAEIDGLRFYAIAPVVAFHINDLLQRLHPELFERAGYDFVNKTMLCGTFGVELFFVISGLILSMPFALHFLKKDKAHPSLKGYYLRRITRLEPPYIISLICLFVLKTLITHKYGVVQLAPNLFASLFYVHNIVFGQASLVSIVTWSLEVEVQFYIAAPLLVQLFRIRNRPLRLLTLCCMPWLVQYLAGMLGLPVSRMNVIGNLPYFTAGIILTDIYLINLAGKIDKSALWDILGALAWAAIGYTVFNYQRLPVLPYLIIVAYVAAFRGRISNVVARNPILTTIGGMCYTTYLFHNIIIQSIGTKIFSLSGESLSWPVLLAESAVIFAITIAICSGLFLYFEKPFMYKDWPSKLAVRIKRILNAAN